MLVRITETFWLDISSVILINHVDDMVEIFFNNLDRSIKMPDKDKIMFDLISDKIEEWHNDWQHPATSTPRIIREQMESE